MGFDIKKFIANVIADLNQKVAKAEEKLDAPIASDSTEVNDPEAELFGARLRYAVEAAEAHRKGLMPWRAGYRTEEDFEWCTNVAHAVRGRRGRPTHPDADIEQALLDAFGS